MLLQRAAGHNGLQLVQALHHVSQVLRGSDFSHCKAPPRLWYLVSRQVLNQLPNLISALRTSLAGCRQQGEVLTHFLQERPSKTGLPVIAAPKWVSQGSFGSVKRIQSLRQVLQHLLHLGSQICQGVDQGARSSLLAILLLLTFEGSSVALQQQPSLQRVVGPIDAQHLLGMDGQTHPGWASFGRQVVNPLQELLPFASIR
mmetsp:Transcript_20847/g.49454  ORF Transcript_20847/g.49454 Transcript_20847/m.49454 type:complete len:201 (+) Transcript_20847:612-1214(+)